MILCFKNIIGLFREHFLEELWRILPEGNIKKVVILVILIRVLAVCQKTFKLEVRKMMALLVIQKLQWVILNAIMFL